MAVFRYMHELQRLEYVRITGGHANRGFTYQVSYWDHYEGLRARLKQSLQAQIEALRAVTPAGATAAEMLHG